MRCILGKIEAEPRGHRVGQKRQNLRAAMRSAQRAIALDIPVSVSAIPREHGHTRSKGALAGIEQWSHGGDFTAGADGMILRLQMTLCNMLRAGKIERFDESSASPSCA
ncbi:MULTISPECIES: hypothetical protein [unclassified Rhizobium]|uniref:hypothetical protein n=1 Tax=unclassified Rhizobium TaxID=2613769 RepID=UPI001FD864FC|nr:MULTISPECIES: hypothetical protein [unclassified Rhizobium]